MNRFTPKQTQEHDISVFAQTEILNNFICGEVLLYRQSLY